MLSSFWQTIYILAFQLSSPESGDSVLLEQTMEIREEAINVAREFIGTFKGKLPLSMQIVFMSVFTLPLIDSTFLQT